MRWDGTDRRKRTGMLAGAARAEMTVLAVRDWRLREVARETSSLW